MKEYAFRLLQNGVEMACAYSNTRSQALSEIHHYAAVYGQDGPVTIEEFIPTELDEEDEI